MASHNSQRGMSLMGMVIVLAVLGVFAYVGMKLFPMYSEYSGVKESMNEVAAAPGAARMTRSKILDLLDRRFNISYVDNVKPEHITIEEKPVPTLKVKYEVRKPMMYNIDVVTRFEYSVQLNNTSVGS